MYVRLMPIFFTKLNLRGKTYTECIVNRNITIVRASRHRNQYDVGPSSSILLLGRVARE